MFAYQYLGNLSFCRFVIAIYQNVWLRICVERGVLYELF